MGEGDAAAVPQEPVGDFDTAPTCDKHQGNRQDLEHRQTKPEGDIGTEMKQPPHIKNFCSKTQSLRNNPFYSPGSTAMDVAGPAPTHAFKLPTLGGDTLGKTPIKLETVKL